MPLRATQIVKHIHTAEQFALDFNLDSAIERYLDIKDQETALLSNKIRIRELALAYSEESIIAWIQSWLLVIAKYMDFSLSAEQVKTTATMIIEECYMLNIAEFTLMFRRILRGNYGIFYGKFNGQTIMTACKDYRSERGKVLSSLSSEEQKKLT